MASDVIHSDAVSAMQQHLSDNSIDLVLTSPPYDDLRTYNDSISWSWEVFVETANELTRVLKPGGVIVWNTGDQTVNGSETGNSFRQALHFKDSCGLRLHDTMIWQKSNFSNPSQTRYHQVFEYVFILSKGAPKTFNPIIDRKNIYGGKPGSFGENTVTNRDGSKSIRDRKVNREYGMRHNVWVVNTAGQEQTAKRWGHPAMFSLEFAMDQMRSWSNEGDLAYDPFGGSGTTAEAAIRLGRQFVVSEIDATYCEIIKERIDAALCAR
jgi:site-specific DNA-methyltransferase (adenine-specific)